MRRRKLLVALAGLAVVVTGLEALWPLPDRITRENCGRVREGMSRAEVEAILGPPGDYRTAIGVTEYPSDRGTSWRSDPNLNDLNLTWQEDVDWAQHELFKQTIWVGDTFFVQCRLDDSGYVKDIRVLRRRTTQTAFEGLLWRAKRQWHRWFPE